MKSLLIFLALASLSGSASAATMFQTEMACRSISDAMRINRLIVARTPVEDLNDFFNRLIAADRCVFLRKGDHVIVEKYEKKTESRCVIPDGKVDCYWFMFEKEPFMGEE